MPRVTLPAESEYLYVAKDYVDLLADSPGPRYRLRKYRVTRRTMRRIFVVSLKADGTDASREMEFNLPEPGNPAVGARPFRGGDPHLYASREAAVASLMRRVNADLEDAHCRVRHARDAVAEALKLAEEVHGGPFAAPPEFEVSG